MSGRLLLYAAAAVLVRLADEGARVGLALLALQRTGSAATGGALVAALLVPHVVAAPVVGLLADRARRPRLVVAAAALVFGATLAAVTAGLGRLPLPVVLGVLLAGGCAGPALTGALSSQLAGLVAPEGLPRAFGLDALTYNLAGIAGPGVAAVLAGVASPGAATYALAVGAGVGAVLVAALPVHARAAAAAAPRAADLLQGARVLVADRVLAAVTAASTLGQLGIGALPVAAAVLAERRDAPATAGWLMTALAVGGLFGSLAWTWRPAPPGHAPTVVMAGLVLVGAPLAVAAAVSSTGAIAALFAVSGFFDGPLFGALLVTRQEQAPPELRSQVFTLGAGAKITAAAAGAALAGLVAEAPVGVLFVLAAAGPVLGGAVGQVLLRGARQPRAAAHSRASSP